MARSLQRVLLLEQSRHVTHMQQMNAIYLRTYMYVCTYVFMEINPMMVVYIGKDWLVA